MPIFRTQKLICVPNTGQPWSFRDLVDLVNSAIEDNGWNPDEGKLEFELYHDDEGYQHVSQIVANFEKEVF